MRTLSGVVIVAGGRQRPVVLDAQANGTGRPGPDPLPQHNRERSDAAPGGPAASTPPESLGRGRRTPGTEKAPSPRRSAGGRPRRVATSLSGRVAEPEGFRTAEVVSDDPTRPPSAVAGYKRHERSDNRDHDDVVLTVPARVSTHHATEEMEPAQKVALWKRSKLRAARLRRQPGGAASHRASGSEVFAIVG